MATPDRTLLTEANIGDGSPLGETFLDIKKRLSRMESAPLPAHAGSHATGGSDPVTPAGIGAVNGVAIQPAGEWADIDANTLLTQGRYSLLSGTSKNTPNVGPSTVGILEVLPRYANATSVIAQRYLVSNNSGGTSEFIRSSLDGGATWRAWQRVVADGDARVGDSGWRRIDSNAHPSLEAVAARIRRAGPTVTLYFACRAPAAGWTNADTALTLPDGFRLPAFQMYLPRGYAQTGAMVGYLGNITMYNMPAGTTERWLWTWMTDDAWPSQMPGVAA